jgi:putative heme iron utilization protein
MLTPTALGLFSSRGFGVLATLSTRVPDFPFGSIVTYALDADVRPIFLLSALAVHTTNLRANSKASLLVFAESAESDPLGSARLNVFGEVELVSEAEISTVRGLYLARHPEAEQWVDFGDFTFYRMSVRQAYYVGGFGVMGWM